MTSIVRVNALAYGPIYRTLDLGAQGICAPHIDTGEDARKFVEAAKFAPLGGAACSPAARATGCRTTSSAPTTTPC